MLVFLRQADYSKVCIRKLLTDFLAPSCSSAYIPIGRPGCDVSHDIGEPVVQRFCNSETSVTGPANKYVHLEPLRFVYIAAVALTLPLCVSTPSCCIIPNWSTSTRS